MSRIIFTLFDDNRPIFTSDVPEAGLDDLLAFSGYLLDPIGVEEVQTLRTLWLSVGVRAGSVRVTLTYDVLGEQNYIVLPGRPLVIETISTTGGDELQSVLITPVVASTYAEILVYPGEAEEPPDVPLDALLILDAASQGVTVEGGRVVSWVDTRAISGAQEPFIPSNIGPLFNGADSDYNGQPTISFSSLIDTRLISGDLPSVFDFLGTGPFTIACVCSFDDAGFEQYGISNASLVGGGFTMGADGGNRSFHLLTDDSGDPNNAHLRPSELNPRSDDETGRATVYVIRYDGENLRVWRQGIEVITENSGVAATSVLEALVLGGSPAGPGSLIGGITIANLQIWDRYITDVDRDGYITFATAQYGVDDSEVEQAPAGAFMLLRANRGVLSPSGNVISWIDTRPEGTTLAFEPEESSRQPGIITDSDVGGRSAIDFERGAGGAGAILNLTSTDAPVLWNFLSGLEDYTFYVILRRVASVQPLVKLVSSDTGPGTGMNMSFSSEPNVSAATIQRTSSGSQSITLDAVELFVPALMRLLNQESSSIMQFITDPPAEFGQAFYADSGGAPTYSLAIGSAANLSAIISAPVHIAEIRIYKTYFGGPGAGSDLQFQRYANERYGTPL